MENIVKELVYIEERARGISRKSGSYAAEYRKKLIASTAEIRKKAEEEADLQISRMKSSVNAKLAAALEAVYETAEAERAHISKSFSRAKPGLCTEIFNQITGAPDLDG